MLGCLFAVVASTCFASTYYVGVHRSDNNPGTAQAPWATLQHAVDSIAPGDTILVTAGTYVGCRIGIPGGPSAPKTLEEFSTHRTRIMAPCAKARVAGFQSDYNVVNVFSNNNDSSTINLAKWQSHGYDLHSIIATQEDLFVNPAANNYQLKAGAPAISAGTT